MAILTAATIEAPEATTKADTVVLFTLVLGTATWLANVLLLLFAENSLLLLAFGFGLFTIIVEAADARALVIALFTSFKADTVHLTALAFRTGAAPPVRLRSDQVRKTITEWLLIVGNSRLSLLRLLATLGQRRLLLDQNFRFLFDLYFR